MMTLPDIEILPAVRLGFLSARLGGRRRRINWGAWAVYLPQEQLKLLHSVGGAQHCIYHKAPGRAKVLDESRWDDRRDYAAWKSALTKPVALRAAENWIALQRLHAAGLGPEPLALCAAPDYRAWFSRGATFTVGYRVANLYDCAPRPPVTEAEMRAAGVIPDASRASLREQINGYVSDLNNLTGVMPDAAEVETEQLAAHVRASLPGAPA